MWRFRRISSAFEYPKRLQSRRATASWYAPHRPHEPSPSSRPRRPARRLSASTESWFSPLPGQGRAVIGKILPRILKAQTAEYVDHAADAVGRRQFRVGAAHVRPYPAGVQGHDRHAAVAEINGQALHHHVERRFAAAINIMGARLVVGDAAHLTAEAGDLLFFAPHHVIDEAFHHARRRQDVDGEYVGPCGIVNLAQVRL